MPAGPRGRSEAAATEDRYVDSPRPEIHPLVPLSARRLLDVGCWKGAFGAALKASRPGLVVWAVEADTAAAAVAAGRLDRVVVGSFPEALPPGERFDVVTFIDVLEHFADPWGVLRQTARVLAPGGVVVAAIPNVRHFRVLLPLVLKAASTTRTRGSSTAPVSGSSPGRRCAIFS